MVEDLNENVKLDTKKCKEIYDLKLNLKSLNPKLNPSNRDRKMLVDKLRVREIDKIGLISDFGKHDWDCRKKELKRKRKSENYNLFSI